MKNRSAREKCIEKVDFQSKRNSYTDFRFQSNGLTENLELRKASGLIQVPGLLIVGYIIYTNNLIFKRNN